jgi:hypothetical protein
MAAETPKRPGGKASIASELILLQLPSRFVVKHIRTAFQPFSHI